MAIETDPKKLAEFIANNPELKKAFAEIVKATKDDLEDSDFEEYVEEPPKQKPSRGRGRPKKNNYEIEEDDGDDSDDSDIDFVRAKPARTTVSRSQRHKNMGDKQAVPTALRKPKIKFVTLKDPEASKFDKKYAKAIQKTSTPRPKFKKIKVKCNKCGKQEKITEATLELFGDSEYLCNKCVIRGH